MKRFTILALVGLLFLGNSVFAMNLDSLKDLIATTSSDTHEVSLLCKLAWETRYTAPDEALVYLDKGLNLAESVNFPSGKAKSHLYRGMIQTAQGSLEEAEVELNLALKTYKGLRDEDGIGKSWNKMGILSYYRGEYKQAISRYEKALEHFTDQRAIAMCHNNMALALKSLGEMDRYLASLIRARKTFEKIGDLRNTCLVYGNIGSFYRSIGEFGKSIEIYQKAADLIPESDDLEVQASIQLGLGLAYESAEKRDEAIVAYQAAVALSRKAGLELDEAIALNNLANSYEAKQEYDKATERYEESLALLEKLKNTRLQASVLNNLSEVQHKQGHLQSAIQYMHRALELALEAGDLQNISIIYKNLGELYEEAENPEEALRYQKKYVQVKDSLLDETKLKEIIALELAYESERRDSELAETTLERNVIASTNSWLWLVLGLLGFCLGIAAVVVVWQRRAITTLRNEHFDVAIAYADVKARLEQIKASKIAAPSAAPAPSSVRRSLPPAFETLSKREIEVFLCLANGMPNKAIADELHISVDTVRSHAKNIYGKLNLKNRGMVMQMAHEFGLS